jgi:hypothetical protein
MAWGLDLFTTHTWHHHCSLQSPDPKKDFQKMIKADERCSFWVRFWSVVHQRPSNTLQTSSYGSAQCDQLTSAWIRDMRGNSPRLQGVNAEAFIFPEPRHWRPATGDYFLLFVPDSCRGLPWRAVALNMWPLCMSRLKTANLRMEDA